jgi:hypothetical protein
MPIKQDYIDAHLTKRAAAFTTAAFRQTDAKISKPLKVAPQLHTMGAQNFSKYIGRFEAKPDEIKTKKFTDQQKSAIIRAFRDDLPVRVIGALREHLEELTQSLGYRLVGDDVMHHRRDEKIFNNKRSSLCFVNSISENNPATELWVITFPSRQYVDQIAQLIQAIFDDLEITIYKKYKGEVTVWHFPEIEESLTKWTGFDSSIKSYVRHGDVIAIGNIEFFLPGLSDAGFKPTTPDWIDFGINHIFGIRIFVNEASSARIVLVGIRECFWGEASAYYVKSLIAAGARHILYGSKAASLIKVDSVHEIIAPKSFLTITSEMSSKINPEPEHNVTFSGAYQTELNLILSMFGIHQGGLSVTVPTVIGEDHKQREAYEFQNPTCMDCENGHIAKVVQDFNDAISRSSPSLRNAIKFIPVHFITDYIYRSDEATDPGQGHLAVHATDPDYERRRDKAFRQIGRFFAVYALKYGQREYVHIRDPMQLSPRNLSADSLEAVITEVRPFLDFGYGREAIAALLSLHRQGKLPPTTLLALAMVSQKYGYSEVFLQAASALKFGNDGSGLDLRDKFRFKLFKIKNLTQAGDYDGALIEARSLQSPESLKFLREVDQYCAFQRRLAICFAANGDKEAFLYSISMAKEDASHQGDRQPYQDSINLLWKYIGLLHLGDHAGPIELSAIASDLSGVREVLGSLESKVWWQTNLEKGALAALFLEAVFVLLHGDRRQQSGGLDRLFLASLLNVRVVGHEQSEAYGEIVAGVANPEVREALVLAMRTDSTAQSEFQSLVSAKSPTSINLVHKCLALLHSSPSTRESEMQKVLRPGS